MGRNGQIIKRIVIPLVIVLAAALGVTAVYFNYSWKPILKERIAAIVSTSTDSLYRIEFEDISTNIITGRISIQNISFSPDTGVFRKKRADLSAPRHLYQVAVKEIVLKRVRPWNVYFNQHLELSEVVIDKPKLEVTFNDLKVRDDSVNADSRGAYDHLKPYLQLVKIGRIVLQDADFSYIDKGTSIPRITRLENLTIRISDLLIDSLAQFDRSRLYYTRDIYAELNDYHTITADSNYTVSIGQVTASTAGKYARATNIRLAARKGEMEFSRSFRVQRNRYSVRAGEVKLGNVDFFTLNAQRRLLASSMLIDDAAVGIFLNREQLDSLRDRGANFPALKFREFELQSIIDTMTIRNSRVDYSEYNPDSRRKGTVTFSKINGEILNITNDPAGIIRNPFAEARLTSLLMDRGSFDARLKFDLSSRNGAFDFQGQVGQMDAGMFNSAIRPLSLIEIRSGQLDKLEFSGTGSLQGVHGNLACHYNGLKISLLERSQKTTWLKRRGIASIFANVLIVESDNPSPGRAVRRYPFSYKRPPHSSFFNMIWKGMSSALLSTIGFDAATQREIADRLDRMEQARFEREERRDDRLKRKMQRRIKRSDRRGK